VTSFGKRRKTLRASLKGEPSADFLCLLLPSLSLSGPVSLCLSLCTSNSVFPAPLSISLSLSHTHSPLTSIGLLLKEELILPARYGARRPEELKPEEFIDLTVDLYGEVPVEERFRSYKPLLTREDYETRRVWRHPSKNVHDDDERPKSGEEGTSGETVTGDERDEEGESVMT
jgi:hypothetical protein